MADLYTEADEALKQERLAKLWQDYGIYLVIFVIGSIVLTGALSVYKSWDQGVRERQTTALVALQNASDYPANVLATEDTDMRPGLRAIMWLNAAGEFIQSGKREEALTLYSRLSEDQKIESEFRDLGTLMSVRLQMDKEGADAEELLADLATIYDNKNSLWAAHARLEAAVLTANKMTDYEAAQTHLTAISETPELPESLYQKADALSHLYRMQAPVTATGDSESTPPVTDEKS